MKTHIAPASAGVTLRANACRFATLVFEAPTEMLPMCREAQYAFLIQNRGFKIYMRLPWGDSPYSWRYPGQGRGYVNQSEDFIHALRGPSAEWSQLI